MLGVNGSLVEVFTAPAAAQARFYWRPGEDDAHGAGSCIISICDVDFKYRFEYLGCKVKPYSVRGKSVY